MKYKIHIDSPNLVSNKVVPELVNLAIEKKDLKPFQGYGYSIRDNKNEIIAGSTAVIYYGCMFIELLWVESKYRGQGLGKKLVKQMEELAQEKNCNMITLTTMDWEAKSLYEKLGYYLEFERRGYYENSIRYFFRKDLIDKK